ncbi:tripartite tricarboxylate transporter substrate binding protein [Bordetella petrii]|nr:tripartite tricarboxylate transporter substrate binding protein [Bordetella petrii]
MSGFKTILYRTSLCLALMGGMAGAQAAQDYPRHAVRFLVPYGAGTSTDTLARILGEAISKETGQSIVVEDRPGAEGAIGVQAVAKAPADGYTVLITTSSTQVLNVHLYKKLPYDPVKDFIPVRTLGQSPMGMSVNADSPFHSVSDFLKAAHAEPGKLTFGSATSVTRLAGEMLQQLAGIKLLNVPYKSNAASANALIAKEVDTIFSDPSLTIPYTKEPGARLRILGVSANRRTAALPDVPTMIEAGVPDYTMSFWYGAWVPAGTPPAVVEQINGLLDRAMKSPSAQAFLKNGGAENFGLSGKEFADFQASEIEKYGVLIKAAGIEPQ